MRVMALLLAAAMLLCGCINFGGQITTNIVQQRTGPAGADATDPSATTQPAALRAPVGAGGNTAEINVEIHDGGTSLGLPNPSEPAATPTSQPSASASP